MKKILLLFLAAVLCGSTMTFASCAGCEDNAAIVNDQHPLATKTSVTLQELVKFSLVLPAVGMQARNAFEQLIANSECSFRIKAEISYISLLFKLVHQTHYVSILAESAIVSETGLRAIPIDAPSNHMQGCIHTLKDAYQKPSAREFIRMLSQSTAILHNTTLSDI